MEMVRIQKVDSMPADDTSLFGERGDENPADKNRGENMNTKLLKNIGIGVATAAGIGALVAGYTFAVRPWHLRWGATDEELTETLPGDDVKPDAGIQVTHAVTINAPAEDVWQWLVQIGQDRGGFYSYDRLENLFGLQIKNTDEIKAEWQKLEVGDFVRSAHKGWLGGRFDNLAGWFVVGLEANRVLVLRDEIEKGSWAFILKPLGERQTRLIIRARGDAAASFSRKLLNYGFFEPAHFIMERKMLLTLKEKAEGFTRAPESNQIEISTKTAAL